VCSTASRRRSSLERVRHRLAAARILLDRANDRPAAEVMLKSAMRVADRWLSDSDAALPDQLAGGQVELRSLASAS